MKTRTMSSAKRLHRVIIYTILIIASAVCIFPFLWMVSTSFKPMNEVYIVPPTWIPANPTLMNYVEGWAYADFNTYTKNTLFLATVTTLGTVISAAVVAYGFSRFKAPFSGTLFTILLATLMLPSQVTLIPQYLLYNKLKLLDSYWPLIIPSWLGGGAFNIFLYVQFFKTMPKELDEAAYIDGANSFQIFTRILMPSIKPVILAVTVMGLVYNWNDFFTPMIYLNSEPKYTIAIGLRYFQGAYGNMKMGYMMAVTTATLLPVLFVFFVAQKYFIQGIKMSGLKA